MSDLTIRELKEKLKMVTQDLQNLSATGESIRKIDVLTQYKEYIEDEIKFLSSVDKT